MPMIEKTVHTAKQAVKAIVEPHRARDCPAAVILNELSFMASLCMRPESFGGTR